MKVERSLDSSNGMVSGISGIATEEPDLGSLLAPCSDAVAARHAVCGFLRASLERVTGR